MVYSVILAATAAWIPIVNRYLIDNGLVKLDMAKLAWSVGILCGLQLLDKGIPGSMTGTGFTLQRG